MIIIVQKGEWAVIEEPLMSEWWKGESIAKEGQLYLHLPCNEKALAEKYGQCYYADRPVNIENVCAYCDLAPSKEITEFFIRLMMFTKQ